MFRALYAHHKEVELYYVATGIITLSEWPSGAQVERELPIACFVSQNSLLCHSWLSFFNNVMFVGVLLLACISSVA